MPKEVCDPKIVPLITFADNNNSGEAGKVGSPSKPDDKNNQFLEPTFNELEYEENNVSMRGDGRHGRDDRLRQ